MFGSFSPTVVRRACDASRPAPEEGLHGSAPGKSVCSEPVCPVILTFLTDYVFGRWPRNDYVRTRTEREARNGALRHARTTAVPGGRGRALPSCAGALAWKSALRSRFRHASADAGTGFPAPGSPQPRGGHRLRLRSFRRRPAPPRTHRAAYPCHWGREPAGRSRGCLQFSTAR